jgi:hypothetical protein
MDETYQQISEMKNITKTYQSPSWPIVQDLAKLNKLYEDKILGLLLNE